MEELFAKLTSVFSVEYMISTTLASYFVIKIIDALNGDKIVPTWLKRTISCVVGAILFVVFKMYTGASVQCLIASFFTAIFVYDVAIKYILKKFNIDYRS